MLSISIICFLLLKILSDSPHLPTHPILFSLVWTILKNNKVDTNSFQVQHFLKSTIISVVWHWQMTHRPKEQNREPEIYLYI